MSDELTCNICGKPIAEWMSMHVHPACAKALLREPHPLVCHIIYGDIGEVPLSVLGVNRPNAATLATMDDEQRIRLAAAATLQQWLDDGILVPNVEGAQK